ncbi:MAG: hypothetical protein M0Z41_08530 [Peptococcaceae bacterium]|jgi:hypothetical protein|nr:hypothetical protein [Peptococcaceae bacterium]
MVWILKRLVVMVAGLMFFYGTGSALAGASFQASATAQSSGGVVISWQDPGVQATSGLYVTITGSDSFSAAPQFDTGQVVDPDGQAGTTYIVTENQNVRDLVQTLASVSISASATNPVYGTGGGTQDEQGSPMERFLAIPINAIANSIAGLIGLLPLDQLIFSSNAFLNQGAWDIAMQWYQGLTLYAVLAMALVLLFLAWQASRAQDERERAEAYKGIWRWVFGFLLLYLAPWLATAVFTGNGALVHFAQVQLHGISVDNSVATGNVLSDAIIALYMSSLKLYFNILYVIRAVFTLLLLAIAPIVIWTYVLNPTRQSFIMWSAELFSNIMMQAAHALTLSFFFAILTLLQGAAAGSGVAGILGQWWAKIVIITLVIPIGQFLRNLINMWLNIFGVREEQLAAGATAGIAGIMGLPRIMSRVTGLRFPGAVGGGAAPSSRPDAGSGGAFNRPPVDDGPNGEGGEGFGAGQTYAALARGAALAGGAIGATFGMPFGESQAFATAGASLGRRVVSNLGQAHQALAQRGDYSLARGAGALVGGAVGGHLAGQVATRASRLARRGTNQGGSAAGQDPPGKGGGQGSSGNPPGPGSLTVAPDATRPAVDLQAGRPSSATSPRESGGRAVPGHNETTTPQDSPPVSLEDIIDFRRLL